MTSPALRWHTARRYARLTFFLGGVSLRRLVEYRADFLLGAVGFLCRVGVQVLLIQVIFRFTSRIGGWDRVQVLFLLGYALIPRGLDRFLTDYLWVVGGQLVRNGDFYRHLIRPINPLFSVVAERFFWPDAIGEVIVGFALLGYSGSLLHLDLSPARVLAGLFLAGCGAAIYTAVKLFFAALAFWTVTSFPSMHAANQLSEFAGYPLEVYPGPLRALLTWLVPFAFTSYLPVTYLLFGSAEGLYLTPVAAVASFAVAFAVWRAGLRRYEMTGS